MRPRGGFGGPRGAIQLACLVAAAGLTGVAALAFSDANSSWQDGVRLEEARSAAIQEQVRAIYGDEAPAAVRIIMDERLAARLTAADPLARSQQKASADAAEAMRGAYATLLPKSLAAVGGEDVIGRLRTLHAEEPPPPNPEPQVRAGDAAARRGGLFGAGAIVLSLVPALLALRRRGRHRAESKAAELLPQPGQEPDSRRRPALIHLALWLLAAAVPVTQLALSAEEQRSQGAAARHAARLTTDIAAGNARTQFGTQARQSAREWGVRAEGRRADAAASERGVADAEDQAAVEVEAIVLAMARPPVAADGLDPRMATALASEPANWAASLAAERDEVERANRWGDRSNNAIVLVALLAGVAYGIVLLRERIAVPPPQPVPATSDPPEPSDASAPSDASEPSERPKRSMRSGRVDPASRVALLVIASVAGVCAAVVCARHHKGR
ncbi:hypothetical protein [Actinoplanes sp. NPDC051859]|uniref:hypothetical protein n=1 Tax=Actinoplanes sp. NPDC051859 TaxID=3363909 RepID=UPI0037AC623A